MFNDIDDKIKVFISSKIDEIFKPIRSSLIYLLKETGLVNNVYMYEKDGSKSCSNVSAYMDKIPQSDVILLLVNNDEGITDPIMDEYKCARSFNKRILIFFLKGENNEDCEFKKMLMADPNNNPKFYVSDDVFEMQRDIYKSFIEDIINVYKPKFFESSNNINNFNDEALNEKIIDYDKEFLNEIKNNPYIFFESYNENGTAENVNYNVVNDLFSAILYKKSIDDVDFSALKSYLSSKYNEDLKEILIERLNAVELYLNGKLNEAFNLLTILLKKVNKNKVIPNWMINDIALDHYNLDYILNFKIDGEGRKTMNDSKENVFFPEIDRYSSHINSDIVKNYKKVINEKIYSISFDNIENQFENIKKYFYISIFYGSITHIELIKKLYLELLESVFNREKQQIYLIELLKFKILLNDKDNITNIIACINNSDILNFIPFNDFIKSINFLKLERKQIFAKLLLLEKFGDIIDDNVFNDLEQWLFNYTNNSNYWLDININSAVVDAVSNCSKRFKIENVINFLHDYIIKSNYHFHRIRKIFRRIDYSKLKENESLKQKLENVLVDGLNKEYNYSDESVKYCSFFYVINTDFSNLILVEVLKDKYTDFYEKNIRVARKDNENQYYISKIETTIKNIYSNIDLKDRIVYSVTGNPDSFNMINSIIINQKISLEKDLLKKLILCAKKIIEEESSYENINYALEFLCLQCNKNKLNDEELYKLLTNIKYFKDYMNSNLDHWNSLSYNFKISLLKLCILNDEFTNISYDLLFFDESTKLNSLEYINEIIDVLCDIKNTEVIEFIKNSCISFIEDKNLNIRYVALNILFKISKKGYFSNIDTIVIRKIKDISTEMKILILNNLDLIGNKDTVLSISKFDNNYYIRKKLKEIK